MPPASCSCWSCSASSRISSASRSFASSASSRDELLIVLGTSSSETVLPRMIQKMERLGASKAVVGLVNPDRLQLQSRRHQHLHDPGDPVPGAGDQHTDHPRPGADHPGDRDADLEGCLGRHRRRLRPPWRRPWRSSPTSRSRRSRSWSASTKFNERVPGVDQPDRQRRGDGGDQPPRGRARPRRAAQRAGPPRSSSAKRSSRKRSSPRDLPTI